MDILQCHNMFQIELAAKVSDWDDNEEIGNVFTASVSTIWIECSFLRREVIFKMSELQVAPAKEISKHEWV